MKRLILAILLLILGLNTYFHFFRPDPITAAKIKTLTLSRGDRYYYTLRLWYLLAQIGDWDSAAKLEPYLDPADTLTYRTIFSPAELKKRQNSLAVKPDKTTEDWLELARIQIRLGKIIPALASLSQAQKLDPLRDDIAKMISELKN